MSTVREIWFTHRVVRRVAMAPPAVRTVVIMVHAWRNEAGAIESAHDVYPVLALRTVDVAVYHRKGREGDRPVRSNVHRELARGGWHFDFGESGLEEDVIIVAPEYGRPSTADLVVSSNGAYRVVVCPWDISEDEDRLIPHIDRLTKEVTPPAEKDEADAPAGVNP